MFNWFHLESLFAKRLGFQNLKTTLDNISRANLNLSETTKKQVEWISKSLAIIIEKWERLDTKIDHNYSEISYESIQEVINVVNELLKETYGWYSREDINELLEESEKDVVNITSLVKDKKKTSGDLAKVIRTKKEIKIKLDNIELLEEIKTEIKAFKVRFIKLLRVGVSTEKAEEKKGNKSNIPKKDANPVDITWKTTKTERGFKRLDFETIKDLYEQNNFVEELRTNWDNLPVTLKLDVCYFLKDKNDLETLKLFFKSWEYTYDKLSENYQNKYDELIDFITPKRDVRKAEDVIAALKAKILAKEEEWDLLVDIKPQDKIEQVPFENKQIEEVEVKSAEERFEEENWYKLDELFFTNLEEKDKKKFIEALVESDIGDISSYEFLIDFIIHSINSWDFIFEESYLRKYADRLNLDFEEEEKSNSWWRVIKFQLPVKKAKVDGRLDIKTASPSSLKDAGIASIPGWTSKRLREKYKRTRGRVETLDWEKFKKIEIEEMFKVYIPEFHRNWIISQSFQNFIKENSSLDLFTEVLVDSIIKQEFNESFFDELSNLNLDDSFYVSCFKKLKSIDVDNILLDKISKILAWNVSFYDKKEINKEDYFDPSTWKNYWRLTLEKKIKVLKYINTYKEFKEFYDKIEKWHQVFVSKSKKQEDLKNTAINYFELFIETYNRLEWEKDESILMQLNKWLLNLNDLKKVNKKTTNIELINENTELREKLEKYIVKLKQLREENEKLITKNIELLAIDQSVSVEQLKTQNAKLLSSIEDLNQEISRLSKENNTSLLDKKLSKSIIRLENLKEKNRQKSKEITALKQKVYNRDEQIRQLKSRISNLEESERIKDAEILSFKSQIEQLEQWLNIVEDEDEYLWFDPVLEEEIDDKKINPYWRDFWENRKRFSFD